ncbi:MAG TPA: VOC family protein [Blastocatellia bacterium]|nr:VOC family protein [Blastocatellia bacterium]
MAAYVPPGEQLVVELYVRDIKRSREFYEKLGFEMDRDDGNFLVLKWEDALLFLEEVKDAPPPPAAPVGNIRIMVPDVDSYWELSERIGAEVIRPIEDRYYGLRDFTIAGPDGLAIRFGTRISDHN